MPTKRRKPVLSENSLMKNSSTRLRFSVWVIIANFILGIVGMFLGADLTALGVFISLCNTPLYAYILGRSFRGATIPDQYFNQPHGGAGGLGPILNDQYNQGGWGSTTYTSSWGNNTTQWGYSPTQRPDEFNNQNYPQTNIPLQTINKPSSEIG